MFNTGSAQAPDMVGAAAPTPAPFVLRGRSFAAVFTTGSAQAPDMVGAAAPHPHFSFCGAGTSPPG